jgi:glucose-6-phosphate 1-dehydrogenase
MMRPACNLILFGITGDLAKRKLLPALYHLEADKQLALDTRILGVSRSSMNQDQLHKSLCQALHQNVSTPLDEFTLQRLLDRFSYQDLAFGEVDKYVCLQNWFNKSTAKSIFYFATPASLYSDICHGLHSADLIRANSQVVLEKPIGYDLISSAKINDVVAKYFSEEQIYRIDHYLGKETVLNLLVLRFANSLFTSNWDHNCIDHVQISVEESVGLGDRWGFFDKAGQMRDMVQNHLLQILCLLAMEPPVDLSAESIRNEKLKVLKALRPINADQNKLLSVRGQYSAGYIDGKKVPGYNEEADAERSSHTETFVALKVNIDNWRWSGVPFYLRTGKRLAGKQSEINIHFKAQPHNIFRSSYPRLPPNKLTIRLQPDEGIDLSMMNKVPGITELGRISENQLDLSFGEVEGNSRIVDAYERLLLETMQSNQSWFVRRDEVEAAWQWIDQIIQVWGNSTVGPDLYQAGSQGPVSAFSLIARDGREWDN